MVLTLFACDGLLFELSPYISSTRHFHFRWSWCNCWRAAYQWLLTFHYTRNESFLRKINLQLHIHCTSVLGTMF